MNNFDVANIKKIINSRKPIQFYNYGDYKVSDLEKMSDEELKTLIRDFENDKYNTTVTGVREIVDSLFKGSDGNTILLSCCEPDYDELVEGDPEDMYISLNSFNKWCISLDLNHLSDEKNELLNKLKNIIFEDLGVSKASEFFEGDSSINEYWSGYIAITKDYKVVYFICREDCLMLNNNINNPDILYVFD